MNKKSGHEDNFAALLGGLDDLTQLHEAPVQAPSPAPAGPGERIDGGVMIRVDLIDPDPNQPRKKIDHDTIAELAKSIKEQGQLQPINIRPNPDKPGRFLINWGERRWRAFGLNGEEEVRAEIKEHEDVFLAQMTENLEREDLSPMEIAYGIEKLIKEKGYTQQKIMAKLGKSQAWVSNYVQLPRMPDFLRDSLEAGTITDLFTAVEAFRIFKEYPERVTELVVGAASDSPVDRSALRSLAAKAKSEDLRPKAGKAKNPGEDNAGNAPAPAPAPAPAEAKPDPVSVTIYLHDQDGSELGTLVFDSTAPAEVAKIKHIHTGDVVEVPWSQTRIHKVRYH